METNIEVGKTILNQIGGTARLKMFVGAKGFIAGGNSVGFSFKGSKRANSIRITLNSMDTYDMEFFKVRGFNFKVVETCTGIYCDMLKSCFEKSTGLYLSL